LKQNQFEIDGVLKGSPRELSIQGNANALQAMNRILAYRDRAIGLGYSNG